MLLRFRDSQALLLLLPLLTVAVWIGSRVSRIPAGLLERNSTAWQQAARFRSTHPHLVRWSLLTTEMDRSGPVNVADTPATITWNSTATALQTVAAHEPALAAVSIDQQPLESRPFSATAGFTFEMWFRWHDRGSVVGANNSGAGTLVALGDGVHDGFALSIAFPAGIISYSLGRPVPKGGVSIVSMTRTPPSIWTHLAVVQHSEGMLLYVNGALAASARSPVAVTQPAGFRKLRIGYAGNGDSSVRMDVAEWAAYTQPLSASQISLLAQSEVHPLSEVFSKARAALCAGDAEQCLALLQQIPEESSLAVAARFTAAECFRELQKWDDALQMFLQVRQLPVPDAQPWQKLAELEALALQAGERRSSSLLARRSQQVNAVDVSAGAGANSGFAAALQRWQQAATVQQRQPLTLQYVQSIAPVLQAHCRDCHEQSPWLSPTIHTQPLQLLARKLWLPVRSELESRRMPPAGCPELLIAHRRRILHWISELPAPDPCDQQLTDARRHSISPIAAVGRRLTRTEFCNAIQQLLGVIPRADLLPPPEAAGGEGFDTAAGTLIMSSSTAELFQACVEDCVQRCLQPDSDNPVSPESTADQPAELIRQMQMPPRAGNPALQKWIRLAWRRTPTAAELQRLETLLQDALNDGVSPAEMLTEVLTAVLLSPSFLYVLEIPPHSQTGFRISQHELATRLALFLWSALPDQQLLDAADQGGLSNDRQLTLQIRRMLQHPRASSLGTSFGLQWLGLDQLPRAQKDPTVYPRYSPQIASLMQQEAALLVSSVLRNDRPLEELIAADYVWVNQQLADYYGLNPVEPLTDWQRLTVPDGARGGLLALGAVMVATSTPTRTSPVLRGRWVLDRILGQRVLPAPADVPAFEQTAKSHPQLTLRQQLEQHRSSPSCRACHEMMDSLGFALEELDPVGRRRDNIAGQPIDAAAVLPDGTQIVGLAGLRQAVLQRRNQWLPHLVRKMTGYAAGRELFNSEECLLEEIVQQTEKDGATGVALVTSIVSSSIFQWRRLSSAAETVGVP